MQGAPANEADDPEAQAVEVKDLTAVARHPARQVGGPQQPGRLVQHPADLHFAEGVVAQGHGIGPGVVDPPGLLAGQAHAGDVLAVDHGEGNVFQFLQGPQVAFQMSQAGFAHHVAHRQNGIEHE